jgi:hypothetical protein
MLEQYIKSKTVVPDFYHSMEVTLNDEDAFLKIKETLTRIGIPSKKSKTLFQSCHILHKQGKYFIVHFKELFALDGKKTNISEDDLARRNLICDLLEEWNLLTVVNFKPDFEIANIDKIKIIPFKDKGEWNLETKYSIGTSKFNRK